MTNNFTKEEVETAKNVRKEILSGDMPDELKAVYMAGEICMFEDLMNDNKPHTEMSLFDFKKFAFHKLSGDNYKIVTTLIQDYINSK